MNRQQIEHGQRVVHNFNRSLRERLESRKHCGPYYFTPPNAGRDQYRSFYLASDFMPSLRWQYADQIINLGHYGWFCDQYQDDTIRGFVMRLPHDRGFIAGWTMGEGMISEIETYIYANEENAAYAADSMAEYAAERQREYELEQQAEFELDQ